MEPTVQPPSDDRSIRLRDVYVWIPPRKTAPDPSGCYVRIVDLTEADRADVVRAPLADSALSVDEIREVLPHSSLDTLLAHVRRAGPPHTDAS
jgi:hypothetical protein